MGWDLIGLSPMLKRWVERWNRLPLAQRFVLYGSVVTLAATLLCGLLITTAMTENMLARRATVVSALAQRMLAPHMQHLGPDGTMDAGARRALEATVRDKALLAEFPYLDIWLPDGTILYSSTQGVTKPGAEMPPEVQRAFADQIGVDFTYSDDPAGHGPRTDYIEIVFPLPDDRTGKIAAVAQLREITTSLEKDLWSLTMSNWVIAATVGVIVMTALFATVLEGSLKIERQGWILSRRLAQSHVRVARHRELNALAQRASRKVTEFTDRHLRTIGTDLHDGPVQSIGFAVLKLDQIRRLPAGGERDMVISEVEDVLGGALSEIRAIALSLVLPDIENLNLAEVIERAVQQHIRRTGRSIAVDSTVEPVHVAPELAVCVYRFVQEGLNNAFRHGLPEGQMLTASMDRDVLKLSVINNNAQDLAEHSDHLGMGLYGLRARVQSIGGNFAFVQKNGQTRLEMWVRNV